MKLPDAAARAKIRRRIIAFLAAVVGITIVVAGVRTHRYVAHDQRFCTEGCHVPTDGAQVWHTLGHQDADCPSCHETPLATGYALLWKKATGQKQLPKHGQATPAACTGCHEKKPVEWREIEATEGHRAHRGVQKIDCLSCHGKTAHAKDPPTEKLCLDCHAAQRLHKHAEGAETCLSCHSFAAGEHLGQKPTAMACKGCHADPSKVAQMVSGAPMKVVDDQAIHGGLDCKLCHEPHGHKPVVPEGQPICARCHQLQVLIAGSTEERAAPEGHKNCEGCHKPHAPRKSALTSCAQCHEKNAAGLAGVPVNPLNPALVKPAPIEGVPQITATGASSALRHQSCASCHLPHTWRAERNGCVTCHEDKAKLLATRSPPQHGTCTSCHEVHGPPPTGAVCVSCHAKTKGNHVALAPEKHKDCTSCHDPHQPSPGDTRAVCIKCHMTEVTGVLHGPEGHSKQSCFGCHKPHDDPRAPANICATCHTGNAALVATAGPVRHRTCTSCHEKHQFSITDTAATCATCHASGKGGPSARAPEAGFVDVTTGPHQGECKSCHALHGSPGVPKTACFKCHDKVEAAFKPTNEQHGACRSCHTPHKPAAAARDRCGACHTDKAAVAVKWPAASAHAGACTGCHTPHDVKSRKQCADCHQSEAQSAMGGKHQCAQCHAPHQAPPGQGPAWWSRCSTCHAPKVESAKARGPTHSDCKSCHKPHQFAVPTCDSCHKDITTHSLHATPQHSAKCSACHDPHVKAEPTKAQCLACHTNKQRHEPDAPKCQACHSFR